MYHWYIKNIKRYNMDWYDYYIHSNRFKINHIIIL